jgi:RNase H-fold protein (predicted Holliday junction resolvase)
MRHPHPSFEKLFEEIRCAPNRDAGLQILQRTRQSAREDFPKQLAKLENLLLEYTPFTILATFVVMLDMPDEEQHAFDSQFRKLCRKVKRRKNTTPENIEAIWNSVKCDVAHSVVVAAPVTTDIYPRRNFVVESFAERAMNETGANQVLVILVDVERGHWPYSGIYLLDKP